MQKEDFRLQKIIVELLSCLVQMSEVQLKHNKHKSEAIRKLLSHPQPLDGGQVIWKLIEFETQCQTKETHLQTKASIFLFFQVVGDNDSDGGLPDDDSSMLLGDITRLQQSLGRR